jgi:hypothetical protein
MLVCLVLVYNLVRVAHNKMNNFPDFPTFRHLTLDDRVTYTQFYKRFDPYSDFSFTNLWIWFNFNHSLAVSKYNDNLIIRINNPFESNDEAYTLLGTNKVSETILCILQWQQATEIAEAIIMVPEATIQKIDASSNFTFQEDIENRDYIYDVEQMHAAQGHTYSGYRRSISYFKRHYSEDIVTSVIDLDDYKQRVGIINHLHTWDSVYRQHAEHAMLEGAVLNAGLISATELGLKCLGILIEGKLQAFIIYQIAPQSGFVDINHLKANNDFKGIPDIIFSCVSAYFHEQGIRYINFEQDIGHAGLRAYKESLRPCRYLKRYTITSTN